MTDLADIGRFMHDDAREREARAQLRGFIRQNGLASFSRDPHIGGHVTGSAFILSADRQATLLTHHAKLDRWLQLGGHCDGIADARFVALKEAYEESGLARLRLLDERVFDLDIHMIPANAKEPAHLHYDLRYVMVTEAGEAQISLESKALEWVPLDQVQAYSQDASVLRLRDKARLIPAKTGEQV